MKPSRVAIPLATVMALLACACVPTPHARSAAAPSDGEREPFAAQRAPGRTAAEAASDAAGSEEPAEGTASPRADAPTDATAEGRGDGEPAERRSDEPAQAAAPEPADEPVDEPADMPADAPPDEQAVPPADVAEALPTPRIDAPTLAPSPRAGLAAADDRQVERELRTRYANERPVLAATVDLASFLVERERHDEALVAVERALALEPSYGLRIVRAGLLRDLARPIDAAAVLEALRTEVGAAALPPETLFELAQVQWLAGRANDALVTIEELQRTHVGDPWSLEHAEQVRVFTLRARGGDAGAAAFDARDLLAMLRGAPRPIDRVELLERLTREGPPERESLRLRAVAIASGDPSPAVRSEVLHAAAAIGVVDPDYWRLALADPSAFVRRVAPEACREALGKRAQPLLLEALREETDALSFAALEQALARAMDVPATPCDAKDPAERARIVKLWEERCGG